MRKMKLNIYVNLLSFSHIHNRIICFLFDPKLTRCCYGANFKLIDQQKRIFCFISEMNIDVLALFC